jgi:hypothetical protein
MSALRGSGGDRIGDLALEDEVDDQYGYGRDEHSGGKAGMSLEYWPRSVVTPTMSVRCSADGIISSAINTSFQQNSASRIPIDSKAGLPSGTMIRR